MRVCKLCWWGREGPNGDVSHHVQALERVLRLGENLELVQPEGAHAVLGQHAIHGMPQDACGVALPLLVRGPGAQAAGVACAWWWQARTCSPCV